MRYCHNLFLFPAFGFNSAGSVVSNFFPVCLNGSAVQLLTDHDDHFLSLIHIYSTTKYMDGHGATLGGAIVDGGKFDWMAHADKFPGLCTPDAVSYTHLESGSTMVRDVFCQVIRQQ